MIITLFIDTLKVSLTHSGINAPQRKKEIERYGEREKLYICWYSKLLDELI